MVPVLALATLSAPLSAATPVKPKASKRRPASVTAPARKATTKGKTSSKAGARRHSRFYQQTPTPDRYREIQQALATKGYFHGEVNGEWKGDSADALRRFQAEQNLAPDGKLNSLSLIALGLGPKRPAAPARTPAESESPKADPTK